MFENVTRIEFVIQKQSAKQIPKYHPERMPASFCACSKHYKLLCRPGPIDRGEVVVKLTRRFNVHTDKETGTKTGWYKRERWRPECFQEIIKWSAIAFHQKNILPPLKKDLVRLRVGRPNQLKDIWGLSNTQIEYRARLQRRIATYRTRLKAYKDNPFPSNKTFRAIENCTLQIEIAETALKAQLTPGPIMEPGFQDEPSKD